MFPHAPFLRFLSSFSTQSGGWAQSNLAAPNICYMILSPKPCCLDSWSFQPLAIQLFLAPMRFVWSNKTPFPCKEQASKTYKEGHIDMNLELFPSTPFHLRNNIWITLLRKQYLPIPDSRVLEGF